MFITYLYHLLYAKLISTVDRRNILRRVRLLQLLINFLSVRKAVFFRVSLSVSVSKFLREERNFSR